MKKYLSLLFVLLIVWGSTTSCRDDDYDYEEKIVSTYKAIQPKKKSVTRYLYYEPSVDSGVAATIKGDGEIGLLYDEKIVDGTLWYQLGEKTIFKNDRPKKGWIPAEQVIACGSGTINVEVKSRAKMMKMADQPMAHYILDTKEKIREKTPLDEQALIICTIYSILIWAVFFIIRATHRVRVWHIIVALIVAALQYVILFTCDIYDLSGKFDNFILDLVVGLLWLGAPLAQIWVMSAIFTPMLLGEEALYDENGFDVEDLYIIPKVHFAVTLVSIVVLLGCYHFNKDWVDGAIYFCMGVQGVAFLVLLAVTEGKFLRTLLYMPLFIFMALPTVYISLSSFVMFMGIVLVLSLLFGPIAGGKIADVMGYKIVNAFGQEIDEVDSSGHSSKTGDDYDINSDGTAKRR